MDLDRHPASTRIDHAKPASPRGASPAPTEARAGDTEAREAEWTAGGVGRLGRLLLADVERYLDFFAIAQEA
jgi:hypothetical protein